MYVFFIVAVLLYTSVLGATEISDCKSMPQDSERLACYDDYYQYDPTANVENNTVRGKVDEKKESPLKRSNFSFLSHRQSYFMPVSYNNNRRPIEVFIEDTGGSTPTFDDIEAKFQISFKMNLWDEILGDDTQLMAGYTQKSFWQMYNSDLSSLFRETNYEPELFISKDTNIELLGFTLVNTSLGFVHQSNGRSNLLSRSWNRIYANFVLQKDNFAISIKPWKRVHENFEDDDNPKIEDYFGKYEINMFYKWHDNEFTAMFRNLTANKYSTSYQLSWLYPVNEKLNFYVEYFSGYGEALIDYNHKSKAVGFGITVGKWTQ